MSFSLGKQPEEITSECSVALANLLIENKFQRSRNDYCETFSYIVSWVNDIIIAGGEHNVVHAIKSLSKNNFKMDDRGELH